MLTYFNNSVSVSVSVSLTHTHTLLPFSLHIMDDVVKYSYV